MDQPPIKEYSHYVPLVSVASRPTHFLHDEQEADGAPLVGDGLGAACGGSRIEVEACRREDAAGEKEPPEGGLAPSHPACRRPRTCWTCPWP